jgi:hypothetical protein
VTFTGYQHQGRALRVQSARDVTDREAADERGRNLEERLHAAGKLAAAVVQDFGSLLAGISKRASALESVLSASPDAGTDVASILEAAARGLALTRELERFSAQIAGNGAETSAPVRGNGEVKRPFAVPALLTGIRNTSDE